MIEEKNDNVAENIDGISSNPNVLESAIQNQVPNVESQVVQADSNQFIYNTTTMPSQSSFDTTTFAYTESQSTSVPVEASNNFTYTSETSTPVQTPANTFVYEQQMAPQPVDSSNTFAYTSETPTPVETPANTFVYEQQMAPQSVETNSFNYVEPLPVVPENPVTPGKYEPKVNFPEENREAEETKDSYIFMIVFAIIMIAVVFALPYLASI